jgi:hypothetical protein
MGDTHGPDRCSGTQDADEGRTSAQIMAGPHLGANRRENQNLGPRTRMLGPKSSDRRWTEAGEPSTESEQRRKDSARKPATNKLEKT